MIQDLRDLLNSSNNKKAYDIKVVNEVNNKV